MHAFPKGWREQGIEEREGIENVERQMGKKARKGRNWKEQRGWRMVSTPTRRLSIQLPRGSWDTGVVGMVGARWRHGCAKEREWKGLGSWQSRPTHTSPSPSSVSLQHPLPLAILDRRIDLRSHNTLEGLSLSRERRSLSLSIGFWSSKHLTTSPRWQSQVCSRRVLRVETLTDNGADGGARLKAVAHLTTPQPVSGVNGLFIYWVSTRNNIRIPRF